MTARAGRWFRAALLAPFLVLGASPSAWCVPLRSGRVAVLDPLGSSSLAQHCVSRIRDELTAGGFDVSVVDPGPVVDPVAVAAAMQRQEGTIATVALVGDPNGAGAELWILDRVGATAEVRRIPMPADDREHLAEVLAIRTIEVLKASALKVLIESTRPRPEAQPPLGESVPAVGAAATNSRLGLEAGLAMLASVGGVDPAALPLARARVRLGESVFLRLTAAGLGSRPRVETSIGSATLAQSLAMAELAVALRPGARWRPTFSLGAGALHVRSDGAGVWPYAGVREARWAGALDAGIGLLAAVGGEVSLAFEVHGLIALPHPTVRFHDAEVATVGFPAIVASLTVIAWL